MNDHLHAADVTVVVPAHDAAATLERTLVSLIEQRAGAPAVLVVDDGSSDDTGDIAAVIGVEVMRIERAGPGGPDAGDGSGRRALGDDHRAPRQPRSALPDSAGRPVHSMRLP